MEVIRTLLEAENIFSGAHRSEGCASSWVGTGAVPDKQGLSRSPSAINAHYLDGFASRTAVRNPNRIAQPIRTSIRQQMDAAAGTDQLDHFIDIAKRGRILPAAAGASTGSPRSDTPDVCSRISIIAPVWLPLLRGNR